MHTLWAPWRMAYIGGPKRPGCVLCVALADAPREALVLGTTAHTLVMLNRFPYGSAHCMVAPRRHTASLMALPADEHTDLSDVLRRTVEVLAGAVGAEGMNVGLNLGAAAGAGVRDHLHWHVVPRWTGDTNFMPVLADARVMPQHLLETWEQLRPSFAWLDGPA